MGVVSLHVADVREVRLSHVEIERSQAKPRPSRLAALASQSVPPKLSAKTTESQLKVNATSIQNHWLLKHVY